VSEAKRRRRRRKTVAPLPAIPPKAGTSALAIGRFLIGLTVVSYLGYVATTVRAEFIEHHPSTLREAFDVVSYLLIVTLLCLSCVAYLLARLGYLYRTRSHHRTPRADLFGWHDDHEASLTVLVPSYKEDLRLVRHTLLTAALQEFPDKRIVLCLDDPITDAPARRQALALPGEIESLLAPLHERHAAELAAFEAAAAAGTLQADHALALADSYDRAVAWLSEQRRAIEHVDHVDEFVDHTVLGGLARDLALVATALRAAHADGYVFDSPRLRAFHRRLLWTFSASVSAFERKRFIQLSHEPNKAMNLNSYLSLMGGAYRIEQTRQGELLVRVGADAGHDIDVPRTDYVVTLDADSVLLPEYCARLVHLMELPEFADVAVCQTPYSAFVNPSSRLERLAGASTDLQHRIHQGLTHYGATFWVGANAILRARALDDIATTERVDGFLHTRYIHDRTVIEDTESSVDLRVHGWRLFNYPERLSYSATPEDFGALCIQRRRWADGGLLILPKLMGHLRRRRRDGSSSAAEVLLTTNYLASIAWSSLALVMLLFYPYPDRLMSPLVISASAGYFLAQAWDLRACGYKRRDVLHVYSLNLALLAVNLVGICRSLGQAVTGSKIAFARTPKKHDRTPAPALLSLAPLALAVYSAFTFAGDVRLGHWWHAAFSGANALAATWAVLALVSLKGLVLDIVDGFLSLVSQTPQRATGDATDNVALDWAAVLDEGEWTHRTTTTRALEPATLPHDL
jgi:cellulose synthase/poly-beta-1,6-N-acetylglucosamine synthase-like glycosyltransferase